MLTSKVKAFFLSAAVLCLVVAAGCNENDNPADPGTGTPVAPTGLMATSGADMSVILKWTAPLAASSVTGYELTVTPTGGTAMTPVSVANGATSYTVAGLTEGQTYDFSLKAKGTGTNMSTASTITWAPAKRYSVKLYESNSDNSSGLVLATMETPTRTAGGNRWDIALDTRFDSTAGRVTFDIGSPSRTSYNITSPRTTMVSAALYTSTTGFTSLNDVFDTALPTPTDERLIGFTDSNKGFAFVVKTQDGNWAKILVKADGSGNLLQGTSPNRYVDLDVSYQSAKNVPYALTGAPADNKIIEIKSRSGVKGN